MKYMYSYIMTLLDPVIKKGVMIILTGLCTPHFGACTMQGPGFSPSYGFVSFCVFSEWRWEGIVHLVDIGGIIDTFFSNFLIGHKQLID